jgi:preprotein translocase subunit SecA
MNQQRKSIYALRKQVLEGQYRELPSEEEEKKGKGPKRIVTEADEALAERAKPILEQMVRLHGAKNVPPADAPPVEIESWRRTALETPIDRLGPLRRERLDQDVYNWFGCRVPISRKMAKDPQATLDFLEEEVALSLTEQRERLLDMVEEIVATFVERACPRNKHFEDWDIDALEVEYRDQFGIEATGLDHIADVEELMKKLYEDAESILLKKEEEITPEYYLRLFRNYYLQEIDKQWLEQLSAMDQLRDGIGLRGYGQRDPKKEYKKEGYDLFMSMLERIKGNVASAMFRVRAVREEDVARLEAERKKRADEQLARANAAGKSEPGQAPAAAAVGGGRRRRTRRAAAKPATVVRDRPKIGRNDPCWCGSGKKYKQCHYKDDQAQAAAAAEASRIEAEAAAPE